MIFLIVGYLGLILSVVFGSNQLRLLWIRKTGENVSKLDYGLRAFYSVLLAIYAVHKGDPIFVAANLAAAALSLAVAVSVAYLDRQD